MTDEHDIAYLLVAHGSRRPEPQAELEDTAQGLATALQNEHVYCAYLEIAAPSIPEAISSLVDSGHRRVIVIPWFLNTGRHSAQDIPAIVESARRAHPQTEIAITRAVGLHPGIVGLLADIAKDTYKNIDS